MYYVINMIQKYINILLNSVGRTVDSVSVVSFLKQTFLFVSTLVSGQLAASERSNMGTMLNFGDNFGETT